MKRIRSIIDNLIESPFDPVSFLFVFSGVIALRVFVEQLIAKAMPISAYEVVIEYVHNFFFFLLAFFLLWLLLSFILKMSPPKLTSIFLWASLLIILPPIIDMIKTGGEVYWSFYLLSSAQELSREFLSVFGHMPSGIVYFGTKITFILAIVLLSGLVFFRSGSYLKTVLTAFGSYIVLFFMGSFPTLFVFVWSRLFLGTDVGQIKSFQVAQFFGAPDRIFGLETPSIKYAFAYKLELLYFFFLLLLLAIMFFWSSREKVWAVIKNARYPQLIYHGGLFFIGLGLGFLAYPDNFHLSLFSCLGLLVLLVSAELAWEASVVINDIYDLEIDKISNPGRPLPTKVFSLKEYQDLALILFLLSLLGGLIIGFKFAAILLVYQILAWFYSAPPLRLKKIPFLATIVSSFASLMVLFLGFILMSSDQTLTNLSWRIVILLAITYTISIPIKDFKDKEGDKKYGVLTVPVIFGEEKGRLIVASNLFISYVLSVFFLNEMRLFGWALLFGIISFLIVHTKKIDPKRLPWWVLGTVTLYLIILVKIVFIDHLNSFLLR